MRPLVLVALAAASPARAFEIETTSELWTQTYDSAGAQGGADAARGVGIDFYGNVFAAGTVDGEVNHGTNGYLSGWDEDGAPLWTLLLDAGLVGATDSNDQIWALQVDQSDQITLAGRLPSPGVSDGAAWVRTVDPLDGGTVWERSFIDGVSPEQAAFGAGFSPSNNDVVFAGWSRGDLPTLAGRMILGRLAQSDGADVWPLATYDAAADLFNPDQGRDIAIDLYGTYTLVGRVGVDGGSAGSTANDAQWFVQRYDAFGLALWSTLEGGALDDEATAVVLDAANNVIVAGYTNVGTDNADGRDDDWRVVKYSQFADASGLASVMWTYTFTSTPGASERATAVALDDDGDILVAGTERVGDILTWRVVELSPTDGSARNERVWPVGAADSVPWSLAQQGTRAVVAGAWGNASADFHISYLASDIDLDGTIDDDDLCPSDPNKIDPGACGCNNSDQDADADGAVDCVDICDGDPNKVEPGICGCGFPDSDDDADGVPGCDDACSETPAGEAVDVNGCGPSQLAPVDTGKADVEPPTPDEKGCDASGGAAQGFLAVAAAAALVRRRRS